MTNKEKYKQAFAALHTSAQNTWEVEKMIQIHKKQKAHMATAAAITCAILIGASGTVYAADIGGIQEKIYVWIHGQQTEVDITVHEEGHYTFTYEKDGETKERSGGGISIDENGVETPLSATEIIDNMNEYAEVDIDADGNIWVYYYEQQINITDLFDQDGICRIALSHGDEIAYLEIESNGSEGGFHYSQRNGNIPEEEKPLFTVINL